MGNAMKAMQVALAAGAVALLASATQASAQNMMGYGQKNRDKAAQPQYIPPMNALSC
jgi:heat shock protein HslJ